MNRKALSLALAGLLSFGVSLAAEYQVDKSQKNLVKFISDAPIEDFSGTTERIDGYAYWEGEDPLQKSDVYFEVDLNSIDTGIGLRNRHMRDHYLETDKFPTAHFKGILVSTEKQSANAYKAVVEGKMFIHGVENAFTVSGTVTVGEKSLHVQVAFPIILSDYRIKIPKIMFYKIDEEMALELDFYLKQTKE